MKYEASSCPNCGANYNPAKYQCEYCYSYIFISNDNYKDFSNVKIELPPKPKDESSKCPGVYVFGRLLGRGEKPITLGVANYYTGSFASAGKLLLTNKSLSFSAHSFNIGRQETRIDLKKITNVQVLSNFLFSQQIVVTVSQQIFVTDSIEHHRFVVYHGKEWVQKIKEAIANYDEFENTPVEPRETNYIQELQQLKKLLDMGIITEEEFNMKKRMLLGL